ncbi:MAG: MerR family transcriptional regulator [Planctomycetota bacterium]|nr:MAG: MerR family transcriptional regulator [Planctomycetota bacterium]
MLPWAPSPFRPVRPSGNARRDCRTAGEPLPPLARGPLPTGRAWSIPPPWRRNSTETAPGVSRCVGVEHVGAKRVVLLVGRLGDGPARCVRPRCAQRAVACRGRSGVRSLQQLTVADSILDPVGRSVRGAAQVRERLKALGARLRDEAQRLLDYREIEARSKELGCPVTERTLRFYVSEGVLPPPHARRGGRTPVYEEQWILGALLAIHIMRERFGRSLAEIREVLRRLTDEPALLAEKLQALHDATHDPGEPGGAGPLADVALTREQARRAIDTFFSRLVGADGSRPLQPSEISVLDLVTEIANPPEQRVAALPIEPAAVLAPDTLPEGAVPLERARALEDLFIGRFEDRLGEARRIVHPEDGGAIAAGPRDRVEQKTLRFDEVVDLMKRHRVYDRALLRAMPLDVALIYRYMSRSLFGRREPRLVLAACSVSPLEELVTRRYATRRAGAAELERALELVRPSPGALHAVGVLSTTGWEPGTEHQLPDNADLLVALVSFEGGTRWRLQHSGDARWALLAPWFDPETEREKIDRARAAIAAHPQLALRGGHVVLAHLVEELAMDPRLVMRAVGELLEADRELALLEVGGRQIIKRKRL